MVPDWSERITDAELEVLKVVWASAEPMGEKQIREALQTRTGWSRATVQTLIKRLVDKSALEKEKRNVFHYRAAVTQEEYAKARTKHLLQQVFGGNAKSMFSTMLANDVLSQEEIEHLEAYWRERRGGKDE